MSSSTSTVPDTVAAPQENSAQETEIAKVSPVFKNPSAFSPNTNTGSRMTKGTTHGGPGAQNPRSKQRPGRAAARGR